MALKLSTLSTDKLISLLEVDENLIAHIREIIVEFRIVFIVIDDNLYYQDLSSTASFTTMGIEL
mgnify:FL=1